MVGHGLMAFGQAGNAGHTGQLLAVIGIDFCAALHDLGHVLQLQQAEGGVDLAHLGVDAGGHHGGLIHKAEVFQVVDVLLGLGIRTDDGATLEGIEHLGGVKTQHRQIAVTQDAATCIFHAKGVGCVVDHTQVVIVGNFLNGLGIAGVAIAVHG